ncbi:PQQ-binding-like beta-propeller repeat protein [Nocardia arthritidis]|uniref:PQQ-binding-like beta-propeller repeat protein n=2 Tax=Nocardia arthritidis TaxID=228602 RepID=A0A6G9YQM3_9NOCA|nr:PQQ-binding-like beta-propeller repeat protein [Nocardia arthritidis]
MLVGRKHTGGMRTRRNGLLGAALTCVLVYATACGGDSPTEKTTPPPSGGDTVTLDGAVYGRPMVAGDTIFAATERNSVYAVTGSTVRWRAHLTEPISRSKLPCGDIDPEGITGQPAYDAVTHRLYAVAETADAHHVLYALDADSGAVVDRVPVDPPFGDRAAYLQRPALAFWNGRVYAAFGGNFGDCGEYTGAVAAVDVSNNAVTWYRASSGGRGGIWAPGPPVIANDRLYYSVGNGDAGPGTAYDGTDSVIALTADLRRADFFAPATWAQDNAADKDLGSMNPALVGEHIVIAGKAGNGYVLDAHQLGEISTRAPAFTNCRAFGAAAVAADVIYLPCTNGITAVRIATDGTAAVLWRATVAATGSPVVDGNRIWAADWHSGTLYALDPATGRVIEQDSTGPLPHFATPALSGSAVVLGTMSGLRFIGSR